MVCVSVHRHANFCGSLSLLPRTTLVLSLSTSSGCRQQLVPDRNPIDVHCSRFEIDPLSNFAMLCCTAGLYFKPRPWRTLVALSIKYVGTSFRGLVCKSVAIHTLSYVVSVFSSSSADGSNQFSKTMLSFVDSTEAS